MKPLIGVAILNYNGAAMTIQCLDHLQKLEWPADRLQILVLDNGSTDDSVARLRLGYPELNLIRSTKNLGFAAGSNLAIQSMVGVDHIALLNNDALVEPGWLEPLVEALERDPSIGAACPKILFATTYRELVLESDTFGPLGMDSRKLGVRVSGVRIDGEDLAEECRFVSGFWGREGPAGASPPYRWTDGKGVLLAPLHRDVETATCALRVSAEKAKPLIIESGGHREEFEVTNVPTWIEVALEGNALDLINNAGSALVDGKHAADRGIFQIDRGQFDEPCNVFAWCGCSVLLSRRYLADVGLFDESFFLYYEDFDLSWRGQRRGWSYSYEPNSEVRHFHASTTRANSDLFSFYVSRNRLLVLLKNAPMKTALIEAIRYARPVLHRVQSELGAGKKLSNDSLISLRVLASFSLRAPSALWARLRIGPSNRSPSNAKVGVGT